jgi:hypothetical protein
VCAFSVGGQSVIEGESSVVINDKFVDVGLTIDSPRASSSARIELAILDHEGKVQAALSQTNKISAGKRKYKFAIPHNDIAKRSGDGFAWWRLSYRIDNIRGIVSLSELLADDFVLRAAAFQRVTPGAPLRVRMRTLDPFTERPVKGVAITAELVLPIDTDADEDEIRLKTSARTNGDGFAIVDFKVPANIKLDDDAEIILTGRKNGIVRKIEEYLEDEGVRGSVLLTTDKPLYQPGQTFNVRALYLDAFNTVVPDSELEFTVEDEDDTVVYRKTVSTSAFGIASISWPIPENAKLGTYRLLVEADDDIRGDQLSFKVSRYDLPNFSVTAKAGKSFYLPSDTEAKITVAADYLFGKPVTAGTVRVVEESERKWNYAKQKYEIDEGAISEGSADTTGTYVATFDLRTHFARLMRNQWERYADITFAAYYTDPTTNRTEQRRFDIRLTKEPIHIYFINYYANHPDLPATAYVSTSYADGTPAVCNIEVRDSTDVAARLKTNALGVGQFEVTLPRDKIARSRYDVRISARDRKGETGTFEGSFDIDLDDSLQLTTDKAIYKPGETIEVELRSTRQTGFVYVDVVKDHTPIDSRVVELRNGRARTSLPYRPTLKGDILVAAYTDKVEGRWHNETMRAVRGVIFPERQNLIVDARFTKAEYRPNEDAAVQFSVLDGSRKPIEGAIGLGIFDKAIEERARTENEFGGGYFSRFYGLMGYDRAFGNFSLKDINELDLTRPIEPEMQLIAEIMLAGNWYYPAIYHSGNLHFAAKHFYYDATKKQLQPVVAALDAVFAKDNDHPTDQASFERILSDAGISFTDLKDPWGQNYHAEFSVNKALDVVDIKTTGADKKRGTEDDFIAGSASYAYFTQTGNAIDAAVDGHRLRTGRHIRDRATLLAELAKAGIDASRLKDRWGRDYDIGFSVEGRYYAIRIGSLGPNGYRQTGYGSDDFEVWKILSDYFAPLERDINRILDAEVNQQKRPFARTDAEFISMLRRGGLDLASINDGYGRPVYLLGTLESRYTDNRTIENGKTAITPVTQALMKFSIRTRGADLNSGADDRELANFSGAITEAHKGTGFTAVDVKTVVLSGSKGAISGTVLDAAGAVIPGADVIATDESDESIRFMTKTDDGGRFLLANVSSGRYTVRVSAPNFKSAMQQNVHVASHSRVEVTVTLEVGGVSEVVTVTGAASEVDQVNLATATTVSSRQVSGFKIEFPYKDQMSTPRLREYFPESLVWQPELLTDKKGKAELKFRMADNITTWKMFAIASDKKGKVGVIEKEVTAFQSFFVDLDPPKFLTEGDEIHLPTQIRNYTDRKQKVDVTMEKTDWFAFLTAPGTQRIDVATGASQNAVFGFKAISPVKGGRQRVTAIGQSDSDAIEKRVTVRPDGEEIVRTESKVFGTSARFDIDYPSNALANTQKAELKIYPNLFSHVAESVEGMLERPYGCGEQTISSTYPNLMILKFVKEDTPLRQKAQQYMQKGYERLIGYQLADGGFSYWGGKDEADVALTAYSLRFLNDAREFVSVDAGVIGRAEDWLVRQQRADGSWSKRYRWETTDNPDRTKLITTYVARSLAMRPGSDKGALTKAFGYLRQRNSEIDEPYALALYGLALLDAGDPDSAKAIASRLEAMAIVEGSAVYWKLETNTPFYGWGTAGRVETTALAIHLLTRAAKHDSKPAGDAVSKGLLFLLKNKDRYGVWYSTQTTINVLDAFLALLATDRPAQPPTISVAVNGVDLLELSVAADRIDPIIVDLQGKLAASANAIDVRSSGNGSLMGQTVATHYVDWRDSQSKNVEMGASRALKLEYSCEEQDAAIMQNVSCSVKAERIGSGGYGMLLAEIGTPPGADVSRESLEAALDEDWSLSRYEILPDRIVLYMWSRAGGTKFNFNFRPRYGIDAQTPASTVYDYYNPEARATVAPMRFRIR